MNINDNNSSYILIKAYECGFRLFGEPEYNWQYVIIEERFEKIFIESIENTHEYYEIYYDKNVIRAFYELYGMQYGKSINNSFYICSKSFKFTEPKDKFIGNILLMEIILEIIIGKKIKKY